MLAGRFIIEGLDNNLLLDFLYVLLSLLVLVINKPTNTLLFIALISISVLYNDSLRVLNVTTQLELISALGALITFYISFNPNTLWKKL
jgi:hypothetical protein